jgi:hypothetical protein
VTKTNYIRNLYDKMYADKKEWECPKGGAHYWILKSSTNEQTCKKCGLTIPIPETQLLFKRKDINFKKAKK